VADLLEDVPEPALAGAILQSEGLARERLDRYLSEWRNIQTETDGSKLRQRGLPPGPRYREILHALRSARLDGRIFTVEDETRLLETLLADLPVKDKGS
jgi:tRNA nucleotidyltransferase (CCA-adding enzyme)